MTARVSFAILAAIIIALFAATFVHAQSLYWCGSYYSYDPCAVQYYDYSYYYPVYTYDTYSYDSYYPYYYYDPYTYYSYDPYYGMHCGGFIQNAPQCPAGYYCQLGSNPDVGGTCMPSY